MRRTGKIVNLGAERSGVSQKTGEPWARKQVVMEWMEETHNGDPFKQSVVIEVRGKVNENRCKEAMFKNEDVEFSFFMEHNDYQGKYYNNVNGNLQNTTEAKNIAPASLKDKRLHSTMKRLL